MMGTRPITPVHDSLRTPALAKPALTSKAALKATPKAGAKPAAKSAAKGKAVESDEDFALRSLQLAHEENKRFDASDEQLLGFYEQMLLIRRFEEKAGQLYGLGLIVHAAVIGQT